MEQENEKQLWMQSICAHVSCNGKMRIRLRSRTRISMGGEGQKLPPDPGYWPQNLFSLDLEGFLDQKNN